MSRRSGGIFLMFWVEFCLVKYPHSWWRHQMETFSKLLAICAGNSLITGEFPAQRPVTLSFDVFFDLHLNKRLSKQSWGWWLETPSCSLWHHCNVDQSLQLNSGDTCQTWHDNIMGTLPTSLGSCEGNPLVIYKFSSQRSYEVKLWYSVVVVVTLFPTSTWKQVYITQLHWW